MTRWLRSIGHRASLPLLYLALLLASFELYHAISAAAPWRAAVAQHHAADVINLERRWGLLLEPEAQRLALPNGPGTSHMSNAVTTSVRYLARQIYMGAQMPWLAAMLFWLYLFHRRYLKRMCVAAILTSLAAILLAAIYPVAPPRFALAGPPYWMADLTGVPASEQALVHSAGFNPFASLPSVHVLWALLTGLGLWYGAPGRALRVLAVLFPCAVVAAVVVTGNHYLLDCVASAMLLGVYLLLQEGCLRLWVRRHPTGSTPESYGIEHRRQPNLRPLDSPLLLCALMSCILVLSGNWIELSCGLLLLGIGMGTLLWARRRSVARGSFRAQAPRAEWLCGVLFVVGATAVNADWDDVRLLAGILWVTATLLPLWARTRATVPAQGRAMLQSVPLLDSQAIVSDRARTVRLWGR